MKISSVNSTAFRGMLEVGKDRFFNTDNIVSIKMDKSKKRPYAFVSPNEGRLDSDCDFKNGFYLFSNNVKLDDALEAYIKAASSKSAVVTTSNK